LLRLVELAHLADWLWGIGGWLVTGGVVGSLTRVLAGVGWIVAAVIGVVVGAAAGAVILDYRERHGIDHALAELYRKSIELAWSELEIVWTHVRGAMRSSGQEDMGYVAARLAEEQLAAVVQTHKALREGVNTRAVQKLLGTFYRQYQSSVMLLRDAGDACHLNWRADGNYGQWKTFDAEFLAGLREIMAKQGADELRGLVEMHMWPATGQRDYWA
jgi:hypothetical protein